MDEFIKSLFKDKTVQEISNMMINFNRYQLNKKPYIHKYNKLRKLHTEILESMLDYIFSDKYNMIEYQDIICDELEKNSCRLDVEFDINNRDDNTIFLELFAYDNHPKIQSVTDIYLKNNRFRNEEKIKLLKGMKDSYVGLFKVISVDRDNGYVTYQDVFTNRRFKIIDIAMSSTLYIDKKRKVYTYNRIITVDDISFATGMHCYFTSESKLLKKYIDSNKYKKCSNFVKCLILYDICKKDSNIVMDFNNRY